MRHVWSLWIASADGAVRRCCRVAIALSIFLGRSDVGDAKVLACLEVSVSSSRRL